MVSHVLGVTFTYNPKDGQCQAICCGVGGALTVVGVCTPEDKCKGIEPQEKEEEGHCPGEEKATCPDTCDDGKLYKSFCLPCCRVTVGNVFVHIP